MLLLLSERRHGMDFGMGCDDIDVEGVSGTEILCSWYISCVYDCPTYSPTYETDG
jgi:hypothetical protein